MSTSHPRARLVPRVRPQWFVLGCALVVLAGVLVAWGLRRAGERVSVVQMAHSVSSGHELALDDLAVVDIAYDTPVEGLVPAAALEALVGKVAAIDLSPGQLISAGMWSDLPAVATGYQRVGAMLTSGRFPIDLAPGDAAVVASLDPSSTVPAVAVWVLSLQHDVDGSGSASFTLAVPSELAVQVAQWAANDQLVLVGTSEQERP